METGGIALAVFVLYLRSMGWFISVAGICMMLLNRFAEVGTNFWLSHWTEQVRPSSGASATNNCSFGGGVSPTSASLVTSTTSFTVSATTNNSTTGNGTTIESGATTGPARSTDFYLGIYAMLGLSAGLFMTVASFFRANGTQRASKKLHRNLAARIMACPMSFFDTVPLGRILNRCNSCY